MTFETILAILLASIFTENIALIECLGTGAVLENERSSKRSLVLGLGTTIVMLISTLITWPLNTYLLAKVPYIQTMVFVLVVLIVVDVIHLIAKKVLDNYCKSDFVKFAINGAVLGLCIENTHIANFPEVLITTLGVGLGFTLVLTVFSALEFRIDYDAVPYSFRGLPIHLLIAGMIVLALLCF